ncbi:MAG: phosphoenolpyruvate--protein phosphotransferase [Actinomycetaceae bacterium]|nr:phosphoenolpyruvate--protein phosphotransferase [Actinomycetaceae bacterium]
MSESLKGIGIGSKVAAGTTIVVRPAAGVDPNEPASTEADSPRVKQALKAVADSLTEQSALADDDAAGILLVGAQLAGDRSLAKKIDKKLAAGEGVTHAVHNAVDEFAQGLSALGGYMAERVTDLYDIRDRAIARLRGLPEPGIHLSKPAILVAEDLSPAQTATLDKSLVLGIVTAAGGPTSHTAILCSQRNIPAVVRAKGLDIDSFEDGTELVIDASTGTVHFDLPKDELNALQERAKKREDLLAGSSGPGATADGCHIQLLSNVASPDEAESEGVEGCGLFRTEFLYLDKESAPTFEEQVASYKTVLQEFSGKKVVVRTLDAGADKPLKFASQEVEENPALGKRGLRLSQAKSELLDTQLKALVAASEESDAELWVMAPMVSTEDEAIWFAERARAAGIEHVGIMVEVPAAAIRSANLLNHVDFASIGTNDLTQYTMAADRMQGDLGDLLDAWQPAVLDMIALCCEGADDAQAHVGVCGESASDPLMALVLAGLGVKSLSMAPARVPAVREVLKMHSIKQCQELARLARSAKSAQAAKQAVLQYADPRVKDIL